MRRRLRISGIVSPFFVLLAVSVFSVYAVAQDAQKTPKAQTYVTDPAISPDRSEIIPVR